MSAGLGELYVFEILLSEAASLYVAQDGLNRALDAEFRAVDAQIIVLRVAPGLIAVVLIEAGTILIDFLDFLACLSLIKTLTLLKAFDARIGVAEDKYADNIVSVVEDIVGAATDEDAVFLGCDLADRVELCGNYLHVQTEILIQAIAACMQQESGHALFVVCVNELAAEVGVLCRLVNDLFVVAFEPSSFARSLAISLPLEPCCLPMVIIIMTPPIQFLLMVSL